MQKIQREKTKGWVLLGKNKRTGELIGEIENSFSLGLSSTYIRVYTTYKWTTAQKVVVGLIKDAERLNEAKPDYEWFVARVGSKKCPIKINWDSFYKRLKTGEYVQKYYWRNLPFKAKEFKCR